MTATSAALEAAMTLTLSALDGMRYDDRWPRFFDLGTHYFDRLCFRLYHKLRADAFMSSGGRSWGANERGAPGPDDWVPFPPTGP